MVCGVKWLSCVLGVVESWWY